MSEAQNSRIGATPDERDQMMVALSSKLEEHLVELERAWIDSIPEWEGGVQYADRLSAFIYRSSWLYYTRRIMALLLFGDHDVNASLTPKYAAAQILRARLHAKLALRGLDNPALFNLFERLKDKMTIEECRPWLATGISVANIRAFLAAGVRDPDLADSIIEAGLSPERLTAEMLAQIASGQGVHTVAQRALAEDAAMLFNARDGDDVMAEASGIDTMFDWSDRGEDWG